MAGSTNLWTWIQTGGNSNIVLIGITAWYAILTHRIMRATARQARAILQPSLNICRYGPVAGRTEKRLFIENLGAQAAVFLDVTVGCFPNGRKPIQRKLRGWDEIVLGAGKNVDLTYDFVEELGRIGVDDSLCGYQVSIIAADLSRQIGGRYTYLPVIGQLTYTTGVPFSVRLRYLLRPLNWQYNRIRQRFTKRQAFREPKVDPRES